MAGLLSGGIAAIVFNGFKTSPGVTAAAGVCVAAPLIWMWRGGESVGSWRDQARRSWWVVPGVALLLALVAGGIHQSHRVVLEVFGEGKASVTYGSPGRLTTAHVDLPWSKELEGTHPGEVVTLVVQSNDDPPFNLSCRILVGRTDYVDDGDHGGTARCEAESP